MLDLHLTGVHEDGEHLLLGDDSGGEYRLRLDETVRQAARHEPRPAPTRADGTVATLGPREVQAMIRAGASAQEAADRAGWPIEKVHKFDGPILAERAYVATTATRSRLRGRYGDHGATLGERVTERLAARGVPPEGVAWDSWRSEDGQWTVVLSFPAGGQAREANWSFSRSTGAVQALDDEALWLSGDEDAAEAPSARRSPAGARQEATSARVARSEASPRPGRAPGSDESGFEVVEHEDPFDLMDSVRQHSAAGRRRSTAVRRTHRLQDGQAPSPSALPPVDEASATGARPPVDLAYDPETMPPPPGAHSDPQPEGVDGRPEPEAAALAAKPPARRTRRSTRVAPPRSREQQAEAGVGVPDAPPSVAAAPPRARRRRPSPYGADPAPSPRQAPAPAEPVAPATRPSVASESVDEPQLPWVSELPAPDRPAPGGAEEATAAGEAEGAAVAETSEEQAPRGRSRSARSRSKGRASVPSWDDIMFGGRSEE